MISPWSHMRIVSGIVALLWGAIGPAIAEDADIQKQFAKLDAGGDKRLSLEEFVKLPGDQAVLKRDFRLFDSDGDRSLSLEEFNSVPLGRPAGDRGPLPDPLMGIVEQAAEQMDAAFGDWDENPDKKVTLQDFIRSFLLSFPDQTGVNNLVAALQREADENQDSRVSRDEARRFLEIQLGVRSGDGNLLRYPNGVVVTNAIFITLDANNDNVIDRDEFLSRWWHKENIEQSWTLLDQDKNGSILFDEFQNPKWIATTDPIETFRAWDKDLDALLDEKELLASTPEWNQRLAQHAFPGFDLDRDGKLNLDEFRLLPQSNLVAAWNEPMPDVNRDGVLQFAEFTIQGGRFPLMRLVYFLRLDLDGDGALSEKEFTFKTFAPAALFRLDADGTGLKQVFSSPEYPRVGSPKISRDGKLLVCDAIKKGDANGNRVMLLMTIDGKNVRELGAGMMPTWSADGREIAYSRSGVDVMNLETKAARTLAQNGWGAQWSPDGKRIAYSEGPAIKTINPETREVETILNAQESPYRQIYWNMGWSADNSQLCFKGIRQNGSAEIATVSVVDPPGLKVHYDGDRTFSNNFAWAPDGKRIVFGMHAAGGNRMLMHEFNPQADAEPTLLKGPDPSLRADDVCFSPDGKFLIFNGTAE